MKAWWSDRSAQERRLLIAAAGLTVLFAAFQFVLQPLWLLRVEARATHDAAMAMLADVEAAAASIQSLRGAARRTDVPVRAVVGTSAREFGLAVTRLQPAENIGLDIWLESADPAALFRWIAALGERYGIAVVRASLQASEDGPAVRAQLTLASGKAP